MNENQVDVLFARVERLEQQNQTLRRNLRRTLVVGFGVLVVGIAGAANLQRIGQFDRAVEVADGNGRLRCVMFAADNAGRSGLELRDPGGKNRVAIHTNQNDDPFITFLDKNGKNRIEMGIGPDGDAYLFLRNGNGQVIQNLRVPN